MFVEYAFLYGFWWLIGRVADTREYAVHVIRDPSMFFLLGRLTVAFMGAVTCLAIFHVGKGVYDWRVGLGAALIGATAYAHATHSHIINVDIGMTLAVWVSILAYLKYERTAERRWLISAGVLAGVATAFKLPGAIVLPILILAIGSRSDNWRYPRQLLNELGTVLVTMLVSLTIIAPEWTLHMGPAVNGFFRENSAEGAFDGDMRDAFRLVTPGGGPSDRTRYIKILLDEHNLALTLTGLLGLLIGITTSHRWSTIWGVPIFFFVAIMSASNRGQPEHYLLPIVPSLWLLSSVAVVSLAGPRKWLIPAGLACVVALPLTAVIRQNYEWTNPDTRVVAKEWVEQNVPSGVKILMDGFQYRFTPSPPLIPDQSAVRRQIAGVSSEPNRFRGVSQRTLKLYAEAMESIGGPKYELHSTVWGLAVNEPAYYAQLGFEYLITSSHVYNRYIRGINRERFPRSAKFYDQLDGDPCVQKVYQVTPVRWKRTGPTITVYRFVRTCDAVQLHTRNLTRRSEKIDRFPLTHQP